MTPSPAATRYPNRTDTHKNAASSFQTKARHFTLRTGNMVNALGTVGKPDPCYPEERRHSGTLRNMQDPVLGNAAAPLAAVPDVKPAPSLAAPKAAPVASARCQARQRRLAISARATRRRAAAIAGSTDTGSLGRNSAFRLQPEHSRSKYSIGVRLLRLVQ